MAFFITQQVVLVICDRSMRETPFPLHDFVKRRIGTIKFQNSRVKFQTGNCLSITVSQIVSATCHGVDAELRRDVSVDSQLHDGHDRSQRQ